VRAGLALKTAAFVPIIALLFFTGFAFAGNATTVGGNITNANLSSGQDTNASWHAVVGHASTSAFGSMVIPATPGNITRTTIGTGASICTSGVDILNILFSNSSSLIINVTAGSLDVLDSFINDAGQDGTATFKNLTDVSTSAYGTIASVPTTYTNAPNMATFKMSYLQDNSGNVVFIMPVVDDQMGFDSQLYDFQFMLPTKNTTTNYFLNVDLKCKAPPPPPPPPGPSGGGGGGGGGAGGGFSYTSLPSVDIEVNLGNGIICIVNVKRSLTVSKDYAVVITTLTNKGGPECTMYDFVFQDAIPQDFAQVYEITFSPPYNSVKGNTVFFVFPVFASGESRSLTYSISRQVPQSKVQSFTVPVVLSANRGNPYLNLFPQFNQTQPGKPVGTQACIISVYCEPWGECGEDGYHSQHCSDVSKCTDIEFFNVEKCAGFEKEEPDRLFPYILMKIEEMWRQLEKTICKIYPPLCSSSAPPYEALCLCLSIALIALLLLAAFRASLFRRKKKERGEALEPSRLPLARKEVKPLDWATGGAGGERGRPSEYDHSLELPDEKPSRREEASQHAPPSDRHSHLSPKLRAIIEEREKREEERERSRASAMREAHSRHEEGGHAHARHEEKKDEHRHTDEKTSPETHSHLHHEEKKDERKPVSREPQWHNRGKLTIKPIYPEEKDERERRAQQRKKEEK